MMKTFNISISEPSMANWKNLPSKSRKKIASKALNAFLNGALYPTGPEQIELAIELAESGVDAETISKLSRLEKEVFEAFMPS